MLAGTCIPSTGGGGGARTGGSLGAYWSAKLAEYKNDSILRNDNQGWPLVSTRRHIPCALVASDTLYLDTHQHVPQSPPPKERALDVN